MSTIAQPETSSAHTLPAATITRHAAAALVESALTAAADLGIEAAVAVTDPTGHLKAFQRTDGARFLTAEVAIRKAWTVSSYGVATHVWNAIVSKPEVAQLANVPGLMPVGGGCPIMADGQLVGGIGISGGDYLQDQQVAETALKALGFEVA